MNNSEHVKMDIWAVADADADDGFRLILVPPEKKWWMNDDDVKIGTETVTYHPPENMSREEMARKAVETLRDRQKQIQAEAQRKVMKLQERINNLLQLTHQPEEPKTESANLKVINGGIDDECDIPF